MHGKIVKPEDDDNRVVFDRDKYEKFKGRYIRARTSKKSSFRFGGGENILLITQ